MVHSFDLVISSVGIFSIRGTRGAGVAAEDPMRILEKGYSVTIVLAVLTFGAVRAVYQFLHCPPCCLLVIIEFFSSIFHVSGVFCFLWEFDD